MDTSCALKVVPRPQLKLIRILTTDYRVKILEHSNPLVRLQTGQVVDVLESTYEVQLKNGQRVYVAHALAEPVREHK
mgnify:FL=1